jgi:hypothetical protein
MLSICTFSQVQAIGDKHGLMTNIVELKQGSTNLMYVVLLPF